MQSGERKKENGEGKEMYSKYLEFKRKKRDEKKRRQDMIYRVLWIIHVVIWSVVHLEHRIQWTTGEDILSEQPTATSTADNDMLQSNYMIEYVIVMYETPSHS
ncbi:hypothetical protein POM88_008480 [Heracleum sosnowskyi]|uniref:Transmembrane protein n=1 Tax=Heracleum sosnowskyi TaxID=360622 RepID=A0AAD8J6H1_9APIA|nr:hypothetical protein POM88_008480 [Heracleum sosnowskyi]